MQLSKPEFRNDIQGLRAIAVLMVLLFHIDRKLLPGGFIGVDVFFVISGYLIAFIIAKKKERHVFKFIDFYQSRVKRIVPAYYLVLLFSAIVGAFLYIKSDIPRFIVGLKSAAIFSSNRYFGSLDTYFGAAMNENPLLHTWTLAVEMQFYFFFPFVIYFFSRRNSIIILLLLSAALLSYSQYNIINGSKNIMYFSLLSRVPEFLIGAIIGLKKIELPKPNLFAGLGLLLTIVCAFLINEDSLFPGFLSLIPCAGAAMIVMSQKGFINRRILSSRPVVYIGELSYSIYLWHWPILAFLRYYTMQYDLDIPTILLAILLILVLSEFSYRYVEGHFRKTGGSSVWFKLIGGISLMVLAFCFVQPINSRVYTYSEYYTTPKALGMDSHATSYKKDTVRGAKNAVDTVLLLGDSYGLVMGAYLEEIGEKAGFAFRSVTNNSYPVIPGLSNDLPFSQKNTYENLIDKAKVFYSTKIIFFAKRWDYHIPSFEQAFLNFVDSLSEDQHLIIFSDFPSLDKNPIRVFRDIVDNGEKVEFKKSVPAIPTFIYQLVAKNPNIHILNLSENEVFKDAPFYQDTIMYYDAHHLNRYGAIKYAENTEQKFIDLFKSIKVN